MSEEYKDEEIRHGEEVPPVQYMVNTNVNCYLPDFWIPKEDKYIEVKSVYTLYVSRDLNRKKREAIESEGIKFEYRIYDQMGNRLENENEEVTEEPYEKWEKKEKNKQLVKEDWLDM